MSIKIFQAYYREDQKEFLEPEFTPFDNTNNPVKNLYEHYIYHQVYKQAVDQGLDKWGVFSWQWRKKLQHIEPNEILGIVGQLETTDVTIFNAYPNDELIAYNVWEQGEWSHPGIIDLGRKLLTIMGEHPDLVELPMGRDVYCAANYFVGNKKFWDGLLEFLDRFVKSIDHLNEEDTAKLYSSAGYEPNPNLDYTGFICERLISTYLLLNQKNLHISAWVPYDHPDSADKHNAIVTGDRSAMFAWDFKREIPHPHHATAWIDKHFKSE
jgi:hypothetical protein